MDCSEIRRLISDHFLASLRTMGTWRGFWVVVWLLGIIGDGDCGRSGVVVAVALGFVMLFDVVGVDVFWLREESGWGVSKASRSDSEELVVVGRGRLVFLSVFFFDFFEDFWVIAVFWEILMSAATCTVSCEISSWSFLFSRLRFSIMAVGSSAISWSADSGGSSGGVSAMFVQLVEVKVVLSGSLGHLPVCFSCSGSIFDFIFSLGFQFLFVQF